MDSITQAALGAAIGEVVLGKKIGRKAAVLGAIGGTFPDLDVILYLFYDKLEMLSIHRGFSHSILFSLFGAFLLAYILQRIKWTKNVTYFRLWIFVWLALFTHILLDTFTAYGTQLFLPFSNKRVGFDSVNVIDPVYTIPLLLGLLFSLFIFKNSPKRATYNYIGLGISTFYLICTLGVKSYVNNYFHKELSKQDIPYNSLLTMPVESASINWYGVAKSKDSLYIQKYSILKSSYFPFEEFAINDHLLESLNPKLVETMRWFAKGFYAVQKNKDKIRFYNLQVDMRGIFNNGYIKAPTLGYFEITSKKNGNYEFSSDTHQKEVGK